MNATIATTNRLSGSPIGIFLMINNFEVGGSERQFLAISRSISEPPFQVHLGCLSCRGPLSGIVGDIPEFPLGGSLYRWQSLRARFNLSRHLRNCHVELAHAFDFYTNLTLIPAARFARVPVIIGAHRQLGDLLTPAKFRAQATVFRWCSAIVCNSHAAADRLSAVGLPDEKLVVIGNALPPSAFEPALVALPRKSGALRVGMIARMNAPYKNHAGFLRIAARIHEQLPEVEFLLVGDGPLRPELERQAMALGLHDRAIFLGDRRDIAAVLASMEVAVLTSESESLSNAVLEAMAARLPVVAYDVGGNGELVNDQRGMLITAQNENDFASAVHRLLSDDHLRLQLGENARQFVEENFSLDRIRRQYEDLYRTLLEETCRRKNSLHDRGAQS